MKPSAVCVCDVLPENSLHPKTRILILQHPQEPDKELASAVIAERLIDTCTLKIGLSWRNLSAALGEEVQQRRWGVLFLGTQKSTETEQQSADQLATIYSPQGSLIKNPALDGIVLLDGNWQQAKTLWWRNPWLLKLHRIVLHPQQPSLYGALRREPRKDSLSTIEAIALSIQALEPGSNAPEDLLKVFQAFLDRCRGAGLNGNAAKKPRKDWRRRRTGKRA
jgi:DTW domain-containing protein YfiP